MIDVQAVDRRADDPANAGLLLWAAGWRAIDMLGERHIARAAAAEAHALPRRANAPAGGERVSPWYAATEIGAPARPVMAENRECELAGIGERMNRTWGVNDEKSGDASLDPGAALAEFPELRLLVDLLRAGWRLLPALSSGELVEVRGVRVWPDESVDAITVRFTTDAAGLRRDPSGDVVWERAGDLADVVNGLLALPVPADPAPPRLALRTSTRLWTP